jgi:AraC-like DNA-binding protein
MPRDAARLFAGSVSAVVEGFVAHDDYVRRAALASRARFSAAELDGRVSDWAARDANPVAELVLTASDRVTFERRWNGFNRLAPLAVSTQVEARSVRRESRCGDRDSAFRAAMTARLVERLSPAHRGARRVEHAHRLVALRRALGLPCGAIDELLQLLYASPGSSVSTVAAQLTTSRRSLQRELTGAGVSFRALRQAVRLTAAGHRLRLGAANLTEVAYASGFFDQPHFVRAWRKACGLSPSAYRDLCSSSFPARHPRIRPSTRDGC